MIHVSHISCRGSWVCSINHVY